LLLEMERVRKDDDKGWINRCYVLKDRTDTMNGKVIDYPKFNNFTSVIASLNIGGEHVGVDTTRNSEDMFDDPDYSYAERKKQRDIALEELQEVLVEHDLAGSAAAVQKKRIEILKEVFGTSAKTYIENMPADKIRAGIEQIKDKFNAESVASVTDEDLDALAKGEIDY